MSENTIESVPSRHESFPCDGPVDVYLHLHDGRVAVAMVDEKVARVAITSESSKEESLEAERKLRDTRIEWSGGSSRLVVRGPRRASLAVTVRAPERSRLFVHAGRGSVEVSGTAGRLTVHTGSGDVTADAVEGAAEIKSGSGDVKLGPVTGGLRYRSGSGRLEAASLAGDSRLATGNGDISLGEVRSDVVARTGNGDVRIADAAGGNLVVATGSGDIWIGVRRGQAAEIDVVSGSGAARSELDVADHPPADGPAVRIKARTGSGEAVVARAGA